MTRVYIGKGWGFDVGANFARAWDDVPICLAEAEHARPGHVIGYIAGKQDSALGFLRAERVRVHVLRRALITRESEQGR